MCNRIQATYVSVWDDGIEIETPAMFDRETGILDEVQMAQLPDGVVDSLETLVGEYVRYDGRQYELEYNEDGSYNAIRPYGVFFARNGYAQVMATSCFYACKNMGMPECRYALAETVAYLALAPRSNSIAVAIDAALSDVRNSPAEPVPMHIRNAPTKLMKNLGYGKGYEYAEGTEEKITRMQCLPDARRDRRYYEPGDRGNEVYYRKRLDAIRDWRVGKREDPPK